MLTASRNSFTMVKRNGGINMPYSEAQKRAILNYRHKNFVRLTLELLPEEKQLIADNAEKSGKSMKRYIMDLVESDK